MPSFGRHFDKNTRFAKADDDRVSYKLDARENNIGNLIKI